MGAHTPQGMTLDQLLGLIRASGKQPAERDSFYRVLRTFAKAPEAGETDAPAAAPEPAERAAAPVAG